MNAMDGRLFRLALPALAVSLLAGAPACRSKGVPDAERTASAAEKSAPPPAAGETTISDFEHGTSSSFGTEFRAINDGAAGGISVAAQQLVPGGAAGSAQALRVTGAAKVESFPFPFAGLGLPLGKVTDGVPAASDLRPYKGMQFWVKGNGKKYMVRFQSDRITDFNLHHATFTAGPEWALVKIPFDSLVQFEWGEKVPWREAAGAVRMIMWLNYSAPGEQFGDIDFSVDQVSIW